MRVIELDARAWSTIEDFIDALLAAIGAPVWHGRSLNAFIDSMITGDINSIEPPYEVRIVGGESVPQAVRDYIADLADALERRRKWQRTNRGIDTEVSLQIVGARPG